MKRQIPSLEILFEVTIPLKWLVGYWEISEEHLHFYGGPVNSSTKYFNFMSVELRILFALTLGNSPTGDKQLYEHFGSLNPER